MIENTEGTHTAHKEEEKEKKNMDLITTILGIRTQEDLISKQFLLTGSVDGGRHMY